MPPSLSADRRLILLQNAMDPDCLHDAPWRWSGCQPVEKPFPTLLKGRHGLWCPKAGKAIRCDQTKRCGCAGWFAETEKGRGGPLGGRWGGFLYSSISLFQISSSSRGSRFLGTSRFFCSRSNTCMAENPVITALLLQDRNGDKSQECPQPVDIFRVMRKISTGL